MTAVDQIVDYTRAHVGIPYFSGGGDNDRDGIPDRADLNDGNGVDCSGWVWLVMCHQAALGSFANVDPIPLGSTSTYSDRARDNGWIVGGPHALGFNEAQPGDILIHCTTGDPFHSDGPMGHTGILVRESGAQWITSESAGSHNGVGLCTRAPSFWCLAIRIPGLDPPEGDVMTPAQEAVQNETNQLVKTLLAYVGERKSASRKASDPPQVAGDRLLVDLHEFVLGEHKAEIIAALEQ